MAPSSWVFSVDLDRSNVNNAYVSGMREELRMVGTQFNVGGFPKLVLIVLTADGVYTANQHPVHLRVYRWHDTQ